MYEEKQESGRCKMRSPWRCFWFYMSAVGRCFDYFTNTLQPMVLQCRLYCRKIIKLKSHKQNIFHQFRVQNIKPWCLLSIKSNQPCFSVHVFISISRFLFTVNSQWNSFHHSQTTHWPSLTMLNSLLTILIEAVWYKLICLLYINCTINAPTMLKTLLNVSPFGSQS